jgi:hypothetical protein
LKLFYHPQGRLRLERDDRCWLDVKPVWASPLSYPGKYLGLLDTKDKEILMIDDPANLDQENREILLFELDRRYLSARVKSIIKVSTEFGSTYWKVNTDKGEKEFITQSLQENAQWMGPRQLLLIDVDGNRFEIGDTDLLDERSQQMLAATV